MTAVNDHGRRPAGSGDAHAARTASTTASRRTSPGPNDGAVRAAETASSGDSRNRSSSGGRIISLAGELGAERLDAPDDRDRDARGLPHDEAARRGHLVGERDDRRLELAAGVVGGPAEVDERRETGAPDRHVHHPATPRATEGVGDDDGHVHAEPRRERRPDPLAPSRRGPSAAGSGTRPRRWRRRRRRSRTRSRAPSRRSRCRRAAPRRVASRARSTSRARPPSSATTRPSAFETTFCVTTTTSPSRTPAAASGPREHRREVVARPDLRDALDGQDLDPHDSRSSATRASASAFASSVMIESVTPTRTPVASIRGASPRSASSTTHAASSPR